jgi:ADP-heptose:LPS heptosyltransferase
LLRRNHHLATCQTVTYLKLLGGGSLAIAYPSLLGMKRAGKTLRLVATASTAAFGRSLGVFDEVLVIRDHHLFWLVIDSLAVILKLFRAQAIVDLEIHSRLSTVFSILTMARNRVGAYTENSFWRRGISTHLLYYNKQSPVFGFYDQVTASFGAAVPPFQECVDTFTASIAATGTGGTSTGTSIAIAPACSELSRERMLHAAQWIPVLQQTLGRPQYSVARIHVLGGPGDRPALEPLVAMLQKEFPQIEFILEAGRHSLQESIALLSRVNHVIAIDSALLHFARLLGKPATSYWGPTNPATLLRPRQVTLDVIHYHRIACSPCIHVANEAPCHGHNICMQFAVDPNCGLSENPIWLAQDSSGRGGTA